MDVKQSDNVPSYLEDGAEELEYRDYSVNVDFSPAIEHDSGGLDHTPDASHALKMALLHEASPCDDCCWYDSCAEGMACRTFYVYINRRHPSEDPFPPDVERNPTVQGWRLIDEGRYWRD